jgi:hypothetical protein
MVVKFAPTVRVAVYRAGEKEGETSEHHNTVNVEKKTKHTCVDVTNVMSTVVGRTFMRKHAYQLEPCT